MCAGKYRTAAVTAEGDVFMWEGWSKTLPSAAGSQGSLHAAASSGNLSTPGRASRGSRSSDGPRPAGAKKAALAASTEIRPYRCAQAGRFHAFGTTDPCYPSLISIGSTGHDAVQAAAFFTARGCLCQLLACKAPFCRVEGLKSAVALAVGEQHSLALPGWQQWDSTSRLLMLSAKLKIRLEKLNQPPCCRVEGLKGAVAVAVGEKHSLALQRWQRGPLLDVAWAGLDLPSAEPVAAPAYQVRPLDA